MWLRRAKRVEQQVDVGIVAECEAYLAGRYVEYAAARGFKVPAWAWVNAAAHSSSDRLARLAVYGFGERLAVPAGHEWERAAEMIAAVALEEAHRHGGDIGGLQASLLIPFELQLIEDDATQRLTPGQLVSVALAVLRRHPSSMR